ncbi:MAG: MarR family transcriptional regulator [Actinomycetota bacterium]
MAGPQWLDDDELAAWEPLAALMLLLVPRLDEATQPFGLTFFEYSALVVLERAPDQQLPMKQLAAVASASLSRASHAAKRLEGRGLVERSASPTDGRVTVVTLTAEGRDALVRAAPSHVDAVRRTIIDVLSRDEVVQLGHLAERIGAGLNPDGAPPSRR